MPANLLAGKSRTSKNTATGTQRSITECNHFGSNKQAVSHCMGAHTAALQPADSDDDDGDDRQSTSTAPHTAAADADTCTTCEVCFVASHEGFALVPCGHARFCESCANRVAAMDTCPVCCSNITMVMRVFL